MNAEWLRSHWGTIVEVVEAVVLALGALGLIQQIGSAFRSLTAITDKLDRIEDKLDKIEKRIGPHR